MNTTMTVKLGRYLPAFLVSSGDWELWNLQSQAQAVAEVFQLANDI